MSIIDSLLGRNRELKHEMYFGHQAAEHGEHGSLVGTWIKEGARQPITISFYFRGFTLAPKMTPELMEEIWHHAKMSGICPSHISSYQDIARPRQARPTSRALAATA